MTASRLFTPISRRFLDQPLARKGLIVIAVPLICFLIALASVFLAERESRRAENYVRVTFSIQSDILELHALLAEAASGVRGFLLTGDEAFLTAFDKAMKELPAILTGMRRLIRDDEQRARLDGMEPLVRLKLDGLSSLHGTADGSGRPLSEEIRKTLTDNKALLDTLQAEIGKMREREDFLLAVRTDEADAIRDRSRWITLLGALFGLLGGISAMMLMSNGIVRRVGMLRSAAHKLASGQKLEAIPAGRDELGELAAALQEASRLLKAREDALRESEERFRLLVDGVHDYGIFGLDEAGRVVSWNVGAERITGYKADEVVGGHFSKFYPEDTRGTHPAQELAQALEFGRIEDEGWRLRKDGERFWANVVVTALKDDHGNARGFSKITRDMTERKKTEEALLAARREAERASHAKSEFLSRMSHELRTPLNSILGFGQILEMDLDDPENQFSVRQILTAGRHLLSLIDEVLDMARIEAGRMELAIDRIHAAEVLQEALALARPLAEERAIGLHLDDEQLSRAFTSADRRRLLQVLLNLLSNAIKFNRVGGEIRIVGRADGRLLTIDICDSGSGIAPDGIERLFKPFERLGKDGGATEGTGLGLALSRHLMEAMGGRLELVQTSARGTIFSLGLPIAADQEIADEMRSAPKMIPVSPGANIATVLCIEDNPQSRDLIENIMTRRFGCQVMPAILGESGLVMARQHKPDLILLDLDLPDMSGLDVLRALRSDARTCAIPVVVITADATQATRQNAMAAKATTYITKPIDLRLFTKSVEEIACSQDLSTFPPTQKS
ncbi:PAS domain S-box-containing protein [Neorhizobium huautlense]|uniref:histidine kinase n=1 Tax=Neorhizobium huautlense TaxID=67774 RepID=A0ABT9PRA1_9HYPH|nr:PAS domain S-box protein [Neorhizobium huautlense]MDP9836982.1 PAS domain S-box-containing protein [Neorhizobium huautlense]